NFCNKLWNACRFRALQGAITADADPFALPLTPFAAHLLARLDEVIVSVNTAFDQFEFSAAAGALYEFVWDDLCSRFLETAKAEFADAHSPTRAGTLATIDYTLSRVLRLLHPYTPFITEESWTEFGFGADTIQFAPWPTVSGRPQPAAAVQQARDTYALIDAARRLRGEFQIASHQKLHLKLKRDTPLPAGDAALLPALLNAATLTVIATPLDKTPVTITPLGDLYMPLAGVLDLAKERERLAKELAKAQAALEREDKKLANPAMLEKAPAEKVAAWQALKSAATAQIKKLSSQLAALEC
ncbi:MAG: class I tRNA ligase family protein, partial [Verrucomicrobiales bacterium]|nr:class I tRNA ligase family protein [Verrucomicrobiales bacterium]